MSLERTIVDDMECQQDPMQAMQMSVHVWHYHLGRQTAVPS